MFGFLRGPAGHTTYRQVYARCCSIQKSVFGLKSLPFVSYEGIFLYCCGVDFKLLPAPRSSDPNCCKMRGERLHEWTDAEYQAANFSANLAMLLAKTKLDDDVTDSHSWLARGTRWMLRKSFLQMQSFLNECDPMFASELQTQLTIHQDLERQSNISLTEYVVPTGNAFAAVARLMPQACESEDGFDQLFAKIGFSIGTALIAYDCAVDWKRDQQRGEFNPLKSAHEVDQAFAYSIRQLVEAGWLIGEAAGSGGTATTILQHRIRSISRHRKQSSDATCDHKVVSTSNRLRVARAGVCDCDCCCVACEVCECCVPCGDLCFFGACDSKQSKTETRQKRRNRRGDCDCGCDCGDCDCDGCDACGLGCGTSSSVDQDAKNEAAQEDWIGKECVTRSALTPYGVVEIDGQEEPAKAEFGAIDENQTVVITGKEAFGFVVRLPQS